MKPDFFSWGFAGRIAMLLPSRVAGRTLGLRGPDLARGPEVARPWPMYYKLRMNLRAQFVRSKLFPTYHTLEQDRIRRGSHSTHTGLVNG